MMKEHRHCPGTMASKYRDLSDTLLGGIWLPRKTVTLYIKVQGVGLPYEFLDLQAAVSLPVPRF
jgi:hypothetical protein